MKPAAATGAGELEQMLMGLLRWWLVLLDLVGKCALHLSLVKWSKVKHNQSVAISHIWKKRGQGLVNDKKGGERRIGNFATRDRIDNHIDRDTLRKVQKKRQ